ncbi:MAG: hypothetical protein K9J12_01005 [Melioribacteraceae bacterium]|nr:hypothetical protein [Melioribacteraceae bacterium]MCF8265493.1 hypothetical protein [Melioribacteraceae bacterium]MCF8431934.1 hypothetical protein [Melioribacteraceae bacterium]
MQQKILRILSVFLIISMITGCGTVMKMTGDLVGNLLTQSTDDLSTASIQVYFMRNVYPKEVGTVDVDYFEETWRPGDNMVFVSFLKREGAGMYKIDGTVTIDGTVVEHIANGFYGKWLDADDISPKKVSIKTTRGDYAEFTVAPPPPIKIKSVNGSSSNAVINLEEDFTLEMESPNTNEDTEFVVSMVGTAMGVTAFMDYAILKYQDKITVPQAIWTNALTAFAPNEGPNWLKIERFNVVPSNVTGVGAAQIVGQSLDCFPVTIEGEVDETIFGTTSNFGARFQEDIEIDDANFSVDLSKPTAFIGRPISSGKKFGVASFTVRATKLQQSRSKTSSSTTYAGNYKTTTTVTTTTTRTFPTLPDAYWESLVNKLYADFENVLLDNYNIQLIPIEDVVSAPSYKDLEAISDTITVVEVEKSYKNTKNLIPTTFSAILDNISSTFASDRIDSRLINELGVDGLISVTIDLEMPWDSFTLTPRMSLRISGGPNGYKAGPTIYNQGLIVGSGREIDEAKMDAEHIMDILPGVIRQDELMQALDMGMKGLEKEAAAMSYEKIWNLK